MLDVGIQPCMDGLQYLVPRLTLLNVPVDSIFDEDLLQRGEVPFLLQFTEFNFELKFQQCLCAISRQLQQFRHAQELRLIV